LSDCREYSDRIFLQSSETILILDSLFTYGAAKSCLYLNPLHWERINYAAYDDQMVALSATRDAFRANPEISTARHSGDLNPRECLFQSRAGYDYGFAQKVAIRR
jgi:hypothetical protein